MHVVRLLAPGLDREDQTKDIDFSPSGIRMRWEAGYANACDAIERAPWQGEFGALEGIILHEPRAEIPLEKVAQSSIAPMTSSIEAGTSPCA
jgi:NTE family protein